MSYVADTLRHRSSVLNATGIMMDPSTGLRATVELEKVAQFKFAASYGSESIKRVINGVRPGMREFEHAGLMRPTRLPLGAHDAWRAGGPRPEQPVRRRRLYSPAT
jgi:hypothetical protein